MNEMNFNWDDLRLFLSVARAGGLAPAAQDTQKSAPTLGRRMLHMERQLGRELFLRHPRGYTLTDEGEQFFQQVQRLEQQLMPVIENNENRTAPVIKISAGTWVTHALCNNIDAITGSEKVKVRFITADAVLDIGRREALVGVRNHRPEDVSLAGRRIGLIEFAEFGVSSDVTTWAQVMGNTPSARWVTNECEGQNAIQVTNPRSALDLSLQGKTKLVLPIFIGDTTVGLRRLSTPIEDLTHDQWLVMHHEDRFLPEVRTVIDRLTQVLKNICKST